MAAREKYPKEAEELLHMLPDWQKRFRESVPRWAPGDAPVSRSDK